MSDSLTPAQFAKQTGLSLGYVYGLVWTGKLPATKMQGQWAIPAAEVERRKQQRKESISA